MWLDEMLSLHHRPEAIVHRDQRKLGPLTTAAIAHLALVLLVTEMSLAWAAHMIPP